MAKIILGRKQCQIINEDDSAIIKKIDRELSFFVQGAQYSKAYAGFIDKSGNVVSWDGCEHLLSPELKFAPGLLARVKRVYEQAGLRVEVIDNRPPNQPSHPIDITKKLVTLGKPPYDYQLEAVNTAVQNTRGIIRIATGGGKTIVASLLTAKLGKTATIYVIGKDLLYQIHGLFSSLFDEKIGIIGDGLCEISDINVATIWSVGAAFGLRKSRSEDEEEEKDVPVEKYKQIKSAVIKSRLHIFDECHLAACDTIQGIVGAINPENIYGMSASPWRDDGADLLIENYLGNTITNIGARTLIDQGYLVEPTIRFLSVPPYSGKKKAAYKTIYNKYIVDGEARNLMVAKGAQKLVEQGFQTLVLFNSLNHGKILYNEISKKLSCALLSGQDDNETRQKVKDKLESGALSCVIASRIFDIGVDLPSLSGLVTASAGKSSVRALQRIGRVIRKHPGKSRAAVIEFADQAPFLLDHATKRRQIYESEEFKVQWPGEKHE